MFNMFNNTFTTITMLKPTHGKIFRDYTINTFTPYISNISNIFLDKSNAWTKYGMNTSQRVWKTVQKKNVELGSVERLLVIALFQQLDDVPEM